MSLLNFFKSNSNFSKDYESFNRWINNVLINNPQINIQAFNFNLYEGSNGTYDIQLVGTDQFDEDDPDTFCKESFSTKENICYISRAHDIKQWEDGLNYLKKIILKYLKEGKYSNLLKSKIAVGIGFVDGDIELIYKSNFHT